MTPHYGGPCGHCGGTGLDAAPDPFTSTPERDTYLLDEGVLSFPPTQSPLTLDLGLLEVYNAPLIPNLGYDLSLQDLSPGFFGDVASMAAPSESDVLFAAHFHDVQAPLNPQGQFFTSSDFVLPDDFSAQHLAVPELDLPSDLDTAWGSSPEEFLSPHEPTASSPSAGPSDQTCRFKCAFCSASFQTKPKLNVHVKKHTKPHKCPVAGCGYEAAEKKSLERHIISRAKWDADHAGVGLQGLQYSCRVDAACTYSSSREDNRNRHEKRCPRRAVGR